MRRLVLILLAAGLVPVPGAAAVLDTATVSFPGVNCLFDADCTVTVQDTSAHFTLPAASGEAFLQSRTWPPGETGTPGAGLTAYLYRLDLRQPAGLTALPCVTSMKIEAGSIASLDYDGDSAPEQIFIGTTGGLGSIGPSSVEKSGTQVTFHFQPPVCAGSSPGTGESSYFFGFASQHAPHDVTATLASSLGGTLTVAARSPKLLWIPWPPPWWSWLIPAALLIAWLGTGYFSRRKFNSLDAGRH
ncbi:MAG: hypothetical protein R2991_11760 [Thermoanaerobaculia bacterium]